MCELSMHCAVVMHRLAHSDQADGVLYHNGRSRLFKWIKLWGRAYKKGQHGNGLLDNARRHGKKDVSYVLYHDLLFSSEKKKKRLRTRLDERPKSRVQADELPRHGNASLGPPVTLFSASCLWGSTTINIPAASNKRELPHSYTRSLSLYSLLPSA